jgi:hypothetical protein
VDIQQTSHLDFFETLGTTGSLRVEEERRETFGEEIFRGTSD